MLGDPSYSLICAVRDGKLETAKTLIHTFGLSYSKAWSNGYNLLRDALQNEHEEVTKLLLQSGCKVNSNSKRPTETPLHLAVIKGYTNIVTMLLDRKATVNAKGHSGETPLHCAVERNNMEIVKLLLKRRAYIDARSTDGMTLLQRAVQLNHLAIAEELLNHGAQVNARCTASWKTNYTPLHYAAEYCNESMIKLLLSKGADINATAIDKITPLYVATNMKQEKIVKLLLEKGANVDACDKNGKSILVVAVEGGHLTTIERILHFRPNVNSEANRKSLNAAIKNTVHDKLEKIVDSLVNYGFTVRPEDVKDVSLLHAAVEQGYVKIVEALLKLGADVNTLNNPRSSLTLLHSAACSRRFEIAEMLLRHGANPNAKDSARKQPIFYAIENNDANITKLLLSNGNGVKVTTEILFAAAKKENCEIVEILLQLEPNIDINARDKHGKTILHYTALNDSWEILPMVFFPAKKCVSNEESIEARSEMAKMFLSRGARVNAKTKNGSTALHLAAEGGYAKVVEVLLKNKADVNALAENRTTPLHSSVKRDNQSIVKMLLDHGANINARQKNGTTALHIASKNGCKEVAKLLAERGADLNARDKEKSLPLHLATVGGYNDVVNILLEHEANVEGKNKLGRTALHIAAKHGWPMVTDVLLKYGADINVTCQDSMTPLNYATLGTTGYDDRRDDRFFNRSFAYDFDDDDYLENYPSDDEAFSDPDYDDFSHNFGDDYGSFSDCPCEEVVEILEQHIVTMKALGLYVSDKNLRAVDLRYEHRDILEDCQTEIANMKIKKIGNSNVSFHDILTRDINQLAVYARNESIVEELESKEFEYEFPSYCGMITRRFAEGQKRESLLSSSLKSLNALSGYVLPDLSAIELFAYLNNKDLENLIKADPSVADSDS